MACFESTLTLFISKAVYFLTGIALIATGANMYTDLNSYVEALIGQEPGIFALLLISIGGVIILSTLFGCCDLCNTYRYGLSSWIYAAFLCIVLVLEAATGIAAFIYRVDLNMTIFNDLSTTIQSYGPNDAYIMGQWDSMQQKLECCGILSPSDWSYTPYGIIPCSCSENMTDCDSQPISGQYYGTGCTVFVYNLIGDYTLSMACVGVIFAAIQVICIIIYYKRPLEPPATLYH